MTFRSGITKYGLLLAIAIVFTAVGTPSAVADTISLYNVSGVFSNGQQLSGQISVDPLGIVTNYALNLTGAYNTVACSGLCTVANGTFNLTGGGSALVAGTFIPGASLFTMTYGGLLSLKTLSTTLSWSPVSVPEEPALLQALLAFLPLAGLIGRKGMGSLRV